MKFRPHNIDRTLLVLILGLCGVLALKSQSVPEPMPAIGIGYAVDGISLGMSEEEVRAKWGNLERRYLFNGQFVLSKPKSSPSVENWVRFSSEGKVVFVQGSRLRWGSRLILGPGHDYRRGLILGNEVQSRLRCGYRYTITESRRDLGEGILEFRHFSCHR